MPLDQLRRKSRRLYNKARLSAIIWIVLGLVLCVSFARSFLHATDTVARLGYGMLSLWSLYAAIQAWRFVWPGAQPDTSTAESSLHACLRELERQRDYLRDIWRRSGLIFCFLGLAVLIIPPLVKTYEGPQTLLKAAPFFVLLAVWFAIFIPQRRRNQRRLQREIDDLRSGASPAH